MTTTSSKLDADSPGAAVPRDAGPGTGDELRISVPGLFALSGQPRRQLELHVARVARDVLKEASNLATGRPEGSRKKLTEYHSDHVNKAFNLVAERGLQRRPRPRWYTLGRISQGIFTLLTGGAASLMTVPDSEPFWSYVFVASFTVTLILIVVLEIADRNLAK